MRTKYKPWAEPYLLEHPEVSVELDNLKNMQDYVLEVGSGKGGFLVEMARKFPNKTFIGVERNVTCAGITAKKLVESELTNVKIIHQNIDILFEYIEKGSIYCIFLNFSDPWPKKRHEKRRLTSINYLNKFYDLLSKGHHLYFKTDNDDLYTFTLETIPNSKFVIENNVENYQDLVEFDAMTEYEKSFRDVGKSIHRIILKHD